MTPPMCRLIVLALGLVLALAGARDAAADDRGLVPAPVAARVALVIGNSAYPASPLRNPVNDARAMAKVLRERGFQVSLQEDATKAQMEAAIDRFGRELGPTTMGLVFYAGHGMQVAGRNYLIPVDAKIEAESSVRLRAVDVDVLLDQMRPAQLGVVILDACRNNPFERRFRGSGSGLAQVDAPTGSLIAYATAPGKVASDGDGTHGLYTGELLKAIVQPGLRIEDVFKQVRRAVTRATDNAQVPWEASSLTGDFVFTSAPIAAALIAAAPTATTPTTPITTTPTTTLTPVPNTLRALPMSVVSLEAGGASATPSAEMVEALSARLRSGGLFRSVARISPIGTLEKLELAPRFAEWRDAGAQALAVVRAVPRADGMVVAKVTLWDVLSGREVVAHQFAYRPADRDKAADWLAQAVGKALSADSRLAREMRAP